MIETAALFIFLNKTCFNGIFRGNKAGECMPSFGKRPRPKILEEEVIRAASALLRRVEIRHGDFSGLSGHASPSAFFYLDPPYRPLNGRARATYDHTSFGDAEQARLKEFCAELTGRGAFWLQSNADTGDRFFENLYADKGTRIMRLTAPRSVNARAARRAKELLLANYPLRKEKAR